ncbi:mannose/fructose/sorbose-specific phosphotransferase system IIA component [Enterococcus sp. PF1-24]|uniref:PTS sugar transporter subunit IIA n=1 Tax=unclassified Enterococcus TaxID=2608891 RepID=UPI0024741BE0|nr:MULTISPECIES: PTS sugar transporter subunit IIA [unclassified Enterococcus]MDH6364910.1 mannose/fructose/sorbose-specific phosphotransferase system IIA component [Enterococcus sp. PFB1-1]MDH6402011.1 mannose/fructose/sorbose-specific phosphotransferase system IIA component [Enterococcus sp. PF1-24]
MKQVILVAHGKLALEMKNSVEMIFGELPKFSAVEFCKEDGLDSLKEKINQAVTDSTEQVLILADLFCGTPYNASCAICMEDKGKEYEVVSGMSLPLVLEVASMIDNTNIKEIAEILKEVSMQTVRSFKGQEIEEEEDF